MVRTKHWLIKIRVVPEGEGAPEEVLRAWAGLLLRCDGYIGYTEGGEPDFSTVADEPPERVWGVTVLHQHALEILGRVDGGAVGWWRKNGNLKPNGSFGFSLEEIEVISK